MPKKAPYLWPEEIDQVLAAAAATRYPERDRVVALLSIDAGLRAIEIANLRWRGVLDPRGRVGDVIEVERSKTEHGKRRVPMSARLREALRELRAASEGAGWDWPVVQSERCAEHEAGRAPKAMASDGIQRLFKRLGGRAEVRLSSHSGRRTYATDLLREGAPVPVVQRRMGHARGDQTLDYAEDDLELAQQVTETMNAARERRAAERKARQEREAAGG